MNDLDKRIAELSPAKRALLELRLKKEKMLAQTIQPRTNRGSAAVSFAQQRLWFLDQLEANRALYNVPRALRVTGVLDVDALHRALNELVSRHEPFRTSFESLNGTLRQIIHEHSEIVLVHTDISHLPSSAREERAKQLAREEAEAWLAKDPDLTAPVSRRVRAILEDRWAGRLELARVG